MTGEKESLSLGEVTRQLDEVGIPWALFAGTVVGPAHPRTGAQAADSLAAGGDVGLAVRGSQDVTGAKESRSWAELQTLA